MQKITKLFITRSGAWSFIVLLLFFLAIAIRLLYFPENVYFAYDQARDSYTSLEILKGDLKIVGPPSAAGDKLFAGPGVYYIYAPIYFLTGNNPEALSLFLRIINSAGIFLAFGISTILFNRQVGLLTSLFYAFSYEQTQYSLFLSHQPQAVVPILLFYLGLCLLIFKNNPKGLFLSAVGAGLAVQFHYLYLYLLGTLFLILALFQKIKILKTKEALYSLPILIFLFSTYIISEIKFNFRTIISFSQLAHSGGIHIKEALFILNRFLGDNLFANSSSTLYLGILLLIISLFLLFRKETKKQIIFLLIWLLTSLSPYLFSGTPSYYYNAATNVSILIFVSFILYTIFKKYSVLSLLVALGIIYNNLYLIQSVNPKGPNQYTIIQPGMLTHDQKRALDYVYTQSSDKEFGVKALSVPLNVNTTWSYLFEWYGQQKYGRLPIWIGPIADGYAGLKAESNREKIPSTQFLIIEPTIGIREAVRDDFLKEENYFTRVVDEQQFGTIKIQKREKF